MPRIRVVAEVDGIYRSLFSILEKPNGDLIIPITSAPRHAFDNPVWETATSVLETRISVHQSPNSPAFTTVKKTTNLADGRQVTAVALTDAVKRKSGFSQMLVKRVEYLGGDDSYAAVSNPKIGDRLLIVPDYNPRHYTLFFGLYVGHPDIEFDVGRPLLHVFPIKFRHFQLVAIFSREDMPSHYSSETAYNITFDPKLVEEEDYKKLSWALTEGKSPLECLSLFHNAVSSLTRRHLKLLRKESKDPRVHDWIKRRRKRLPTVKTISIKWGTGQQLVHIVTDGRPPKRR